MPYSPLQVSATRVAPVIISSFDPEMIGFEFRAFGASGPSGAQNWPAANLAVYTPLYLSVPVTAYQLFIENGTAVAGNIDLGLFDESFNKLVSKGSTAQAGISSIQYLDVADTLLPAGRYYIGAASDTSGATQKFNGLALNASVAGMMGLLQSATSFPLATLPTAASYTQGFVPVVGVVCRATN